MKRVIVRYKVKPDRVGENEQHIRAVYEQLKAEQIPGIQYATFKLSDGLSFVHIALIEATGKNPLAELGAFKAFQAQLEERCQEVPIASDMTEIDSYQFFGI